MEEQDIAGALRKLPPIEEKVVRLHYGIGCQRTHSTAEIAEAFGMTEALVKDILEKAEERLEPGLGRRQLQGAQGALRRRRCRARK